MKSFLSSPRLKLLIFIFALGYIIFVFWQKQFSISEAFALYGDKITSYYTLPLIMMLLFMWFNWSIEAVKWQLLAAPIEKITYKHALKAILAGLSLGFVSPHAVGDYAARILMLKDQRRYRTIGAVFLGRLAQFLPTLLLGLFALYEFKKHYIFVIRLNWVLMVVVLVLFPLVYLVYYQYKHYFERLRRYISFYFGLITHYSSGVFFGLIILSFLRYIVFTTQFIFLLSLLSVDLSVYEMIAGVGWIFFAKSVLPSFNFLSDLGIREFSALVFFQYYNVDLAIIVAASLFLWLINIFLPAMVGLVFIKDFKFRVNR